MYLSDNFDKIEVVGMRDEKQVRYPEKDEAVGMREGK